jgi:hypothetical protein
MPLAGRLCAIDTNRRSDVRDHEHVTRQREAFAIGLCAVALCLSSCAQEATTASKPVTTSDDDSMRATQQAMRSLDLGDTTQYNLNAHCGVQFTKIDGLTWRTRLRHDGHHNPPEGWPQLIEGTLERVGEDEAVFRSGEIPETLTFRPAPDAHYTCA